MEYSANPVLVEFRDARVPAEWTSKQAKKIYEAAVDAEKSGKWHDHVITGSVLVDVQPAEPFVSPVGTDEKRAAERVRAYISNQRAVLDKMERELAAYGGNAFTARREAVRAPKHPFDAEAFLLAVMRRPGVRAIWVHGVKFVRNMSGAFARADQSN